MKDSFLYDLIDLISGKNHEIFNLKIMTFWKNVKSNIPNNTALFAQYLQKLYIRLCLDVENALAPQMGKILLSVTFIQILQRLRRPCQEPLGAAGMREPVRKSSPLRKIVALSA